MKTPETVVDFDRTWNGKYDFVRCEECNGHMVGHKAEKCKKTYGYDDALVRNYETRIEKFSKHEKYFKYLYRYKEETRVGLQAG